MRLVQKHKGHSRVDLSLRISQINAGLVPDSLSAGSAVPGCIASTEDHGYIIDFGIEDQANGFLPFENAASRSWRPGKLVSCLVEETPEDEEDSKGKKKKKKKKSPKRALVVTSDHAATSAAALHDYGALSLANLKAGMLVNATVAEVFSSGVALRFFRFYIGVVDTVHLEMEDDDDMPEKGDKVKARILYVDVPNKAIGLSLKDRVVLMEDRTVPEAVAVGTVHEGAKVVRLDGVLGLSLLLPDVEEWTGFAHISQITDDHLEKIGNKYTIGTVHTCRVIGHSLLDSIVNVSMQTSVLEAPFLRIEDIVVGDEVSGKVLKVEAYGVIVTLADKIRGLCPSVHLGEVTIKNPAAKFKPGSVVKCMVVQVDVAKNRVILTMKKSLLRSKLPRLLTWADPSPGMLVEGESRLTACSPYGEPLLQLRANTCSDAVS